MQIRDAKIEDASAICEAEKRITKTPGMLVSRPDELKLESFQNKIRALTDLPNGKYIVAYGLDGIIGHAMLDPMGLAAIEHIVRLTIAVHPGHEEKGVGEAMLTHLIDWARTSAAVQKIELNVRSCNLRAIRLYQKLGFNVESRIRNRVNLQGNEYVDDIEMGLFVKPFTGAPTVVSLAIGKVVSDRSEVIDDNWDQVKCHIELDRSQFSEEALFGLETFSHVEVLFFMDQVDVRKVEKTARHPRNNESWPKVGIFAQRGKNRPNQIASTVCKVKKVDGLNLHLEGLDAVNGTPVLDVKPWVKEFGPRGEVAQPGWMGELMTGYWKEEN